MLCQVRTMGPFARVGSDNLANEPDAAGASDTQDFALI